MRRREHYHQAEYHLNSAASCQQSIDIVGKTRMVLHSPSTAEEQEQRNHAEVVSEFHIDRRDYHLRAAEVHALLANCRIKDEELGTPRNDEVADKLKDLVD